MYEGVWPWLHLAGRLLFAVSFMILSAGHFTHTAATAQYAASKGVPSAKFAVLASGVIGWVGAILVALGWHRFIGAGLIAIFLIPISFLIHNYWAVTDPAARMMDRIQFWKNMAMLGAALLIAVYSRLPWPLSLGG